MQLTRRKRNQSDFTNLKKELYIEHCETMKQFGIEPPTYREWLEAVNKTKF